MDQQLFGIKESAKILGVSFVWLDKRVREEKVTVVRMGGKRMISIEEIERIKKKGVS